MLAPVLLNVSGGKSKDTVAISCSEVDTSAKVRGAAARGPQIRIDCLVEGKPLELLVRDAIAPAGVALGLSVRFRPTRMKLYPRGDDAAPTSP